MRSGSSILVGVAGSVNPQLQQPNWGLSFDAALNPIGWQEGLNSSGAVNHSNYAHPEFTLFGDTPAQCKLLDGLLSAVNTKKSGMREFDSIPSFDFTATIWIFAGLRHKTA